MLQRSPPRHSTCCWPRPAWLLRAWASWRLGTPAREMHARFTSDHGLVARMHLHKPNLLPQGMHQLSTAIACTSTGRIQQRSASGCAEHWGRPMPHQETRLAHTAHCMRSSPLKQCCRKRTPHSRPNRPRFCTAAAAALSSWSPIPARPAQRATTRLCTIGHRNKDGGGAGRRCT